MNILPLFTHCDFAAVFHTKVHTLIKIRFLSELII